MNTDRRVKYNVAPHDIMKEVVLSLTRRKVYVCKAPKFALLK